MYGQQRALTGLNAIVCAMYLITVPLSPFGIKVFLLLIVATLFC